MEVVRIMFLSIFISFVLFQSCRKEELVLIETPEEEALLANSNIASLIQNTSRNDGSDDNILDKSNCFNIKFPVTVSANGSDISITSKDDYKKVEFVFDDNDNDVDILNIIYPITIVLDDYSEVVITNESELDTYSSICNGENEADDDIECIDFQYPINASVFNRSNELISTNLISDDSTFFGFINNLTEDDIVTVDFPISVTLYDGSSMSAYNFIELENIINTHKDDCDEDDDFDYNDDDCNDCTVEQLKSFLTTCNNWHVDVLKRNNNNYDSAYDGYDFNFYSDGRLSVYWGNSSAYGTWIANGSENNITVTIDVPYLPLCNNNWVLHEIAEYTKKRVDLRVDSQDRLRYNNECN